MGKGTWQSAGQIYPGGAIHHPMLLLYFNPGMRTIHMEPNDYPGGMEIDRAPLWPLLCFKAAFTPPSEKATIPKKLLQANMDQTGDLISAIETGHSERVADLLQANPELSHARHTTGVSVILWALYHGQPEIANRLAASRPDLDIFEAAALGRVERLDDLLQKDPQTANAWSPDGFQPLGLACFFRQPEAAHLLLEWGAEVNTPSRNGARVLPLHSAAASGQVEIVRWLLHKGAAVNERQAGGFTALHSAAQNDQPELVDLLLVYGADPGLLSLEGKSPLDLAAPGGQAAVVDHLRGAAFRGRVILQAYDAAWPAMFRAESAVLLPIFEPLLGAIYHIGSTSVPGLIAKPTIDILIEVKALEQVDNLNEAMAEQGYEARGENGIPGRRLFGRTEEGLHRTHVHVFQAGNPEIGRHMAFRDYLRRHPEAAVAYGELKEQLALRFMLDRESYTDGKEEFVREIDRRAAEERTKI